MGSVYVVIRRLGYPSESTLYHWYERRNAGLENRDGHTAEIPEKNDYKCNRPDHPRHPSAEFKYEMLLLRRGMCAAPPGNVTLVFLGEKR